MRRFLIALVLVLTSGCAGPGDPGSGTPRNVIFFIADGCGFATYGMGRGYADEILGRDLSFDGILTGSVATRSSHQRVTDSAASATAYACGTRTRNGRIAVDSAGVPIQTVLEAAERAGYRTGLVTTTRITHATPAAFSAHVVNRASEDSIAVQQLAQGIEVLLGGGLNQFLPREGGGSRADGRNLLEEAEAAGYSVVRDADALAAVTATPVLGLFDPSHVDYEIDRDEGDEPSLAEMTRKALELLSGGPDGFFIMIEAGRIDHAGHGNDAATHLHDLLAYDEAMRVALDFARQDGSTLLVATSDHETGGLAVGRDGVYDWHPEALVPVNRSIEVFGEHLADRLDGAQPAADVASLVLALAAESGMGPFTEEDEGRLREAVAAGMEASNPRAAVPGGVGAVLADILSRRARLGWTSSGHTAVDVPLYATGPGSDQFRGHLRNDELGRRLARVLGVSSGQPLAQEEPVGP